MGVAVNVCEEGLRGREGTLLWNPITKSLTPI